jgi:hypothetical protein
MKTYKILDTLYHDGTCFQIGDTIELPDETAKRLKEIGILDIVPKVKAENKPESKPENPPA